MSIFGEITDFCHLSSDVIVLPNYAPDTLTNSSMHTQINSQHFAINRKSIPFFVQKKYGNKQTDRQTCL